MTIQETLQRALACRHTQSSFRTLDRHREAGQFDRDAAMRLLANNARDYAPVQQRPLLTRLLFDTWVQRHITE